MPQPLMRGDEALHAAPSRTVEVRRTTGEHHLEHLQQARGDFVIALVARLVERDEDLVGKTTRRALRRRGCTDLLCAVDLVVHMTTTQCADSFAGCMRAVQRRNAVRARSVNIPRVRRRFCNRRSITTRGNSTPFSRDRQRRCRGQVATALDSDAGGSSNASSQVPTVAALLYSVARFSKKLVCSTAFSISSSQVSGFL